MPSGRSRRFPGRDLLFVLVLITMMLPYQSTIVPFFLLMSNLGWINTFWPRWIPWWAPAFGVFLMCQIIAATIPDELLDAASIDAHRASAHRSVRPRRKDVARVRRAGRGDLGWAPS